MIIDKVFDLLYELLELSKDEIGRLTETSNLVEYGLDSLKAIEFVVNLEIEFGIEFDDNDLLLDNLDTIEKIISIVEKYLDN